ncbi:hypothetical protein QR680_010425 [Steinernema hermaphroditum]|uniref:Uncharacterized protein n=1 Tax=Steinernema hermaphroditum TaxID=289476 RepID=A0AA39IQH9_9BILA|nr:hypothetical protein QR680_010425 [Steinernema hermaphroditum]
MLDGRNVAVDREDIFQQQLELIETLAKEKDDLQVKLIDQIQVCAKLEYLLMVETEKGERQSERQQKTILQLLEEKQAMMEEMQKLKSPMDVQANNDDQSSADVKRELVDLQLVNSSLKEENHRLQMETQDLRRRLEEQSRSLESLSQKTVTVTPRQYRKVPKTNPNIRTCQLQTQQIHSFQTPPEEPQLQIPRRFVAKLRKDVRRSVPNLHFIEEERPVGTTKEKSKKGLLKRLSLRLVSPNIARE